MTTRTSRKALGTGLDALFDGAKKRPDPPREGHRPVGEVAIDLLAPGDAQPRQDFDDIALDELAHSIEASGVIQPVVARPDPSQPGHYRIIAGERRWRAAQRAGLHTIPVYIKEITDSEALQVALIENVQRVDLNPVEEARGYQQLVEQFKLSMKEIARRTGKSRPHLANTIRLLRLPEGVLAMLESGQLTAGHARPLIDHPRALPLARRIVSGGLSAREAERLAKQEDGESTGTRAGGRAVPGGTINPDLRALEETLGAAVDCPVRIRDRNGRGEIRITYGNYETFDRISALLTQTSLDQPGFPAPGFAGGAKSK